jgi:uncharacterized membrane protein (UPF0127 family)
VIVISGRRILLFLCCLLCLIGGAAQAKEPVLEALTVTTAAGKVIDYRIEVAKTPTQMQRGLMFRDTMPADQGMMFIYVPARTARMWMKNTILSLDMLFVDEDGIIINIAENTTPYSVDTISSAGPVRAVIELNAGQVATHGIAAGDRITHPLFEKPEAN